MELTIASVIAFITLIIGEITKKLGLVNKKYIPIQSVVIGLISGFVCYITDLEPNIITAIITCVICSLSASGLYDVSETFTKN